jgi:predicted aspartyl protease
MRPEAQGFWSRVKVARLLLLTAAVVLVPTLLGCQLALTPATDSPAKVPAGTYTTDVKIVHGGGNSILVLVPVTIKGEGPYNFALDTGASLTLVDSSIANQLGLPEVGDSQQVSGVGGDQQVIPIQVKSWSAGSIPLPEATITKTRLRPSQGDSDIQGLLGSDILSQFGTVTLNYKTGVLTLTS